LCGYETSKLKRLGYHYINSRADSIVALTEHEARILRGELPAAGAQKEIEVIPNGIPNSCYFPPEQDELVDCASVHPHKLLYVGQLVPLKGVDVLLSALKLLVDGGHDVRLDLVSQNNMQETRLRCLATSLGVADKVHFCGIMSPDELRTKYIGADVLVLPSYAEALPSVITEALLCGTPVVASEVGALAEQIGQYGALCTPGNPASVATAIQDVLNRKSEFRAKGQEMHRYARRKFDVDEMVSAHLRLYARVVSRPARGMAPTEHVADAFAKMALRWKYVS
jgi:glycosyltransferase involved in cell wall biosynthesis